MIKKEVIELANKIYKKFNTANPFNIADEIGFNVIYKDMPKKIKGYTLKQFRINLIFINENLTDIEKRNTLLHELGHIFCKHDTNRIFTSLKTDFVINKLENEADLFMVAMLLNGLDKDYLKSFSLEQISSLLGVDKHKVELFF